MFAQLTQQTCGQYMCVYLVYTNTVKYIDGLGKWRGQEHKKPVPRYWSWYDMAKNGRPRLPWHMMLVF